MKVILTVEVDIDLDDGTNDPVAGDPLEHRMRQSAREAVENALTFAAGVGFEHDMADIASIGFSNVEIKEAE